MSARTNAKPIFNANEFICCFQLRSAPGSDVAVCQSDILVRSMRWTQLTLERQWKRVHGRASSKGMLLAALDLFRITT